MVNPIPCPCGTPKNYQDCCEVYHKSLGTAPTAETLMRSRYSAFALNNIDYIQATQRLTDDPSAEDTAAIKEENRTTKWINLDILETEQGTEDDSIGSVTFRANFEEGQHKGELSEKSLFKKVDGQWFYVSGTHEVNATAKNTLPAESNKVGRNDPCACGSGKKFKKCCA